MCWEYGENEIQSILLEGFSQNDLAKMGPFFEEALTVIKCKIKRVNFCNDT